MIQQTWRKTLAAYGKLGFALVLMFGMVGNLMMPGIMYPLFIILLVCVMWVAVRIVQEAAEALTYLQKGEEPKEQSKS